MTQMASQIRSALRGGVSRVGGGGASYHDGISFNAETGKVTIKAPGAAPVTSDLTSAFTFARNGPATYVGPSGQLEWANENNIVQSQTFNTSWSQNNLTVSSDATAAPDGTVTADKLVESATSATHFAGGFVTVLEGSTYTASIYLKAAERSRAIVYWGKSGSPFSRGGLDVDLTTGLFSNVDSGTPTSVTNRTVTDAGNGWWRVSMTVLIDETSTDGYMEVRMHNGTGTTYLGDGTSGLYVWGAQVQRGNRLGTYLATVAAAKYDQPRIEYDANGNCLGLLCEDAATNLCLQSQALDNATWIKTAASVTANNTVAPDGTLTAEKLVEDTSPTTSHLLTQAISFTAGTTYTMTMYVKAAERQWLLIAFGAAAFTVQCGMHFNVASGALGTVLNSATATIEPMQDGWYRCRITAVATTTASANIQLIMAAADLGTSYTGDGASGLYIWGVQVEARAFPTSYIPTTTATVTRTIDFPNRTLGAEYVAGANTVVVRGRFSLGQDNGLQPAWYMYGGADNLFVGRAPVSDIPRFNAFTGGAAQGPADGGTITNGAAFRSAAAWQTTNDMAHSYNGGVVGVDTVATIGVLTSIAIGSDSGGGLNGHILELDLYNTRIPNNQLQLLSAL